MTLETLEGYSAVVRPTLAGALLAARRVTLSSPPENQGMWTIECPSLRGCISQGETTEAALENIREAMELWLEVALEMGDTIPPSDAATGAVAVLKREHFL